MRCAPAALLFTFLATTLLGTPPAALSVQEQEPPLLAPLSDGTVLELPPAERLDPSVPLPGEVLGYPLGARFTHHERILDYLETLVSASERAELWSYGSTYEGRPLVLLAVSAPENIARLEEIRRQHLRLADPSALSRAERERLLEQSPLVVWLGYGVHGNESSSSEAAMAVAYLLAADRGQGSDPLRDAVVLIDPLSNPDGRERYVAAYEQRRGSEPDPDPQAFEHLEPWPGGRQNHYLVDLNRDWSWATQTETRHRLAAYRRWEPQVHVDVHEMSSRSSYFFPPAAEPVHPLIDAGLLGWLDRFGRANAVAFDRYGWLYYKAENFDLFYPGYGDSYPFLRGAVGMTYEMAGGGRAGQALRRPDGSTLTLADRIARHLTSSLATVTTAAAHCRELLADFVAARLAAEREEPTSYLWAADQPEAHALASLLDLHGIQVHRLSRGGELSVLSDGASEEDATRRLRFAEGDYAVSTRQPLGPLVRALLSRESAIPESFIEIQRLRVEQGLSPEFYDITGWALPLAFHLEVWRLRGEPGNLRALLAGGGPEGAVVGRGQLGYLLRPSGLAGYRTAAGFQLRQVHYRLALAPFELDGEPYPSGTLFVPRRGNPEDLDEIAGSLAAETGVELVRVADSYAVEGVSLGSDRMVPVRAPRVGLLTGDGLTPTSVGSLWYLLDREIGLPHTRLDLERLEGTDLSAFDVLVFPDGSGYDRHLGEEVGATLDRWLRAGGTLVAVGGAVEWLQDHDLTAIESWKPEGDGEGEEDEPGRGAQLLAQLPLHTPGAALATEMSAGHPLAAGLAGPPPVLVRGTRVLVPTGKPQQDLLTAATAAPLIHGFAWPEAEERLAGSLLVGVEGRSQGRLVVFAHDPAYRLFWRATMPLLLNAVMHAPSLDGGGRT